MTTKAVILVGYEQARRRDCSGARGRTVRTLRNDLNSIDLGSSALQKAWLNPLLLRPALQVASAGAVV